MEIGVAAPTRIPEAFPTRKEKGTILSKGPERATETKVTIIPTSKEKQLISL